MADLRKIVGALSALSRKQPRSRELPRIAEEHVLPRTMDNYSERYGRSTFEHGDLTPRMRTILDDWQNGAKLSPNAGQYLKKILDYPETQRYLGNPVEGSRFKAKNPSEDLTYTTAFQQKIFESLARTLHPTTTAKELNIPLGHVQPFWRDYPSGSNKTQSRQFRDYLADHGLPTHTPGKAHRSPLPNYTDEELGTMFKNTEGANQHERVIKLADTFGVEKKTLYPRIRNNPHSGYETADTSPIDETALRQLHSQGFSVPDIAKELGVSRSRIRTLMKKGGLKTEHVAYRTGVLNDLTDKEVVDLYKKHGTLQGVVDEMDVDPGSYRKRLNQIQPGISKRKPARTFDDDQLSYLYKSGRTIEQVAKDLDASTIMIQKRLKDLGILRKRGETNRIDLTEDEALAALKKYGSIRAASRELGVAKQTIQRRLRPEDVPKRKKSLDMNAIRTMKKKGVSATDIAKEFGISKATVHKRLREEPPLTRLTKANTVDDITAMMTIEEIGDRFGLAASTVATRIRSHPEHTPAPNVKRATDEQIIDAMEQAGGNSSVAGRQLGLTPGAVTARILRGNLPVAPRKKREKFTRSPLGRLSPGYQDIASPPKEVYYDEAETVDYLDEFLRHRK